MAAQVVVFDSPAFLCYTVAMFHHANKRKQGDLGVAAAISWFTFNGYTVCLPFTEGQKFDLVVVKDEDPPLTVQVKTTGFRQNGNYTVQLRTTGGMDHKSAPKRLSKSIDLLFILTEEGSQYVIPRPEITAVSAFSLTKKWDRFKVSEGAAGWTATGLR